MCELFSQENLGPKRIHAEWRKTRIANGWECGKYNQADKKHPNLCVERWEDLPFSEKVKDFTFWCIIKACSLYDEKMNEGDDEVYSLFSGKD